MKILIVEDDTLLLQGLILAAQTEGYACDGVTTARMAEQSLEAGHYSLVVLDLGLPDEDGLHFLARIRQKKYTLPVLILTARDTLTDKIAGLDVGADDYLVKPFALEELHARIRALLRRHNNQGESELIVGNLTLNMGRRQVWMGGEELILTPKEYALLSRLMLKAGSPAILTVTVQISPAYIFNGSSTFSPSLKAVIGVVGVNITSQSQNAVANSEEIRCCSSFARL